MPTFDASHVLTLLVGAAVAALGFLARRWITGAGRREKIDSFAGVADIVATMKQHAMTKDEVQDMAIFLATKQRDLPNSPRETESSERPDDMLLGGEFPSHLTQLAMNQRAGAAAIVADAQLDQALLELEHFADAEGLASVQRAWKAFRKRQVQFAGDQFDGSMVPSIRSHEYEALTLERLAWVKAELKQRSSR